MRGLGRAFGIFHAPNQSNQTDRWPRCRRLLRAHSQDACPPTNLSKRIPIPSDRNAPMHVPEKHALGLDPMGGSRFSENGHTTTNRSGVHADSIEPACTPAIFERRKISPAR